MLHLQASVTEKFNAKDPVFVDESQRTCLLVLGWVPQGERAPLGCHEGHPRNLYQAG